MKSSARPTSSKSGGHFKSRNSSSRLKVLVYWGDILYDTAICGSNDKITVGRSPENTFVLDVEHPDASKSGSLELLEMQGDSTAKLFFYDNSDGHIRFGKDLLSFHGAKKSEHVTRDQSGRYQAALTRKDKADFVIGHVSFFLDWIDANEIPVIDRQLDWKPALATLIFILLSLGLYFGIQQWHLQDTEEPPERLVQILPRTPSVAAKAAMGTPKTKDGGAQKGELGKASPVKQQRPSITARLQKAGLGSLVSGLTSLGSNAPTVEENKNVPADPSARLGTGGFSSEGLKTGGGGQSIGIGRQVGKGEGGFEGTGRLGLSGDSQIEGSSGYASGATTTGGGLDRDVIESVIRRRLDRIRLCYERQLNFYPTLAGKVSVSFVIGASGQVISNRIVEDTMKNENVRSCINAEVKSWNFPQPEGGTLVTVDYPFFFESSAKHK